MEAEGGWKAEWLVCNEGFVVQQYTKPNTMLMENFFLNSLPE